VGREVSGSRRAALAGVAIALASGCGGARASGAGRAPGVLAVQVVNHVAAPCALGGVVVSAGGQTVRLAPAPPPLPPGEDPAVVAALRLPPGEHTVAARASARCPTGEGDASGGARAAGEPSEPNVLVVETAQVLHLDRGQAPMLTVGLSSPGGALSVRIQIEGATLAPAGGVADRALVCAGVRSTRKALCRAEADLAQATARSNVAWALCVRDQLPALRAATDLAEGIQARADREAEALADFRMGELASRVERCAATAMPTAEPDRVVHQAP